jgi:two-component system, chemotaxis family, chemotaxis protein CheY
MPSVLVIDDDPEVRDSIRQVLSRVGFDVSTADNGETGTQAFYDRPPDVVIVDIIMPRNNGIEVIRKIRGSFPGARIVAITGGGNFGLFGYKPGTLVTEAYLASASASGADAVMTKPFHRTELIALVRSLVKN